MPFCAVTGCGSDSNDSSTNLTFHLLPSSLIVRTQWILALGRLSDSSYVCSRHFEESMFTNHKNTKILKTNAVPKPFMDSSPIDAPNPNLRECSNNAALNGEMVACRVCLAADGRLYAISGSLEATFATITGIALSAEESLPHHLCVFCLAKLSKCAAFRDSCQRATAVLQCLLEKGPLKMNDFKAIDRNSHQLTNHLTWNKVFVFGTDPLMTTPPLIKTENDESSHEVTGYIEVEYLGGKDVIKNDANDSDPQTFEVPIEKHEITEIKLVKLKTENSNTHSEVDNKQCKEKKYTSDFDTDSSDEVLQPLTPRPMAKKGKRKRVKSEKENTSKHQKKTKNVKTKVDHPTDIATDAPKKTRRLRKKVGVKSETESAFEKKFNCKTKVLTKEEQKQEVEERKRNNKSAYSCDLCGKGFKKENTLMTHKTYHDPTLPAECDVCLLRFRSRRSLLKHMDCHRAIFTCNECGNVSRNRSHAKDHCLMHKGTTYTCPYCQIVYNHQTSYYNHIRVQHPGQNEACDLCGETFAAGRGMMLHKALTHKQNDKTNVDFKCTVCEVKFLSAEALRRHEELSVGVSHAALWPCAACGDTCGSSAALAAHAAEQHPPDQHYCEECNKTFSNAASFALHVDRKHKNQRAVEAPFRPRPGIGRVRSTVCEICGKIYQNLTMLQYHMNGHLEVKPFQCRHCPKAFTHQSNHRLHMRVHTGERPYQCEQCPLAFSRRGNFTKHMKNVHLRVQVKCDTCGKMVGAGSLASHIRAVHLRQPYVRRKRNRTADKKLPLDTHQ